MATRLQKRLAQEIVKDIKSKKPRNKKDLLVSAGYDVTTAEATPERTLEQKGVQEALNDLGFSLEEADKVVSGILHHGKEENRLKASDQIYKRLGGYAPDKHLNVNVEVEASPEIKQLTDKLNELHRGTG